LLGGSIDVAGIDAAAAAGVQHGDEMKWSWTMARQGKPILSL
jgi:hypothetical protein